MASTSASTLHAGTVRSVLGGDTLIVRPANAAPNASLTLHLAGIQAPRLGTRDRIDEPGAYAAREALRLLAVGKPVRWRDVYTVPGPDGGRNYVHVYLPPIQQGQPDRNVALILLTSGVVRVHDGRSTTTAPDDPWREPLRQAQAQAQSAAHGLWSEVPAATPSVQRDMPIHTLDFFNAHKNDLLDAVVEQVKDGSMLRVRALLSSHEHQMLNLGLAGARCPRYSSLPNNEQSNEPLGAEATQFVESKLLQRNVKVRLLSLPPSASAAPAMSSLLNNKNQESTPPTSAAASHLIATVLHPAGDIAQFLISNGLAKVVDWHASVLSGAFPGKMDQYRAAQRTAQEQRRGLWISATPLAPRATPNTIPTVTGAAPPGVGNVKVNGRLIGKGSLLSGTVQRIVSPDSLILAPTDGGPEQRVFFASLRAPAAKDEQLAGYAADAREWLRSKTIGKQVNLFVDYIKPRDGDFSEKVCGSLYLSKKKEGSSLGEQLVNQGLLLVQRHRKDDEDVASSYTDLLTAEAAALTARRGLHSGQPKPLPRIVEASESAARAQTFLTAFKRAGQLHGTVEHLAAPARVRVYVPRENARVTLVLAGIRAPRTARQGSNERDAPGAQEALHFAQAHLTQRNVTFEVHATDRTGAFIGELYLGKENYALTLVRQGLAEVHGTADQLPFAEELYVAEEQARNERLGLWKDVEPLEDVPTTQATTGATPTKPEEQPAEYAEAVISDIRGNGGEDERFSFHLQRLNARDQLEALESELSLASTQAAPHVAAKPRPGEWVAVQTTPVSSWLRAIVQKPLPGSTSAGELHVQLADRGTLHNVALGSVRPLDATRFGPNRLRSQATEARLAFVQLWDQPGEDAADAIDAFREAVSNRTLLARIVGRDTPQKAWAAKPKTSQQTGAIHVVLYDPSDERILDPAQSINRDLVLAGWAILDTKSTQVQRYATQPAHALTLAAIREASDQARRSRAGVFVYGDPTAADD